MLFNAEDAKDAEEGLIPGGSTVAIKAMLFTTLRRVSLAPLDRLPSTDSGQAGQAGQAEGRPSTIRQAHGRHARGRQTGSLVGCTSRRRAAVKILDLGSWILDLASIHFES